MLVDPFSSSFLFTSTLFVITFVYGQKKNLCKSCWHMYHLWGMKRHAANRPARHRGRNSKLAREQHASSPPPASLAASLQKFPRIFTIFDHFPIGLYTSGCNLDALGVWASLPFCPTICLHEENLWDVLACLWPCAGRVLPRVCFLWE